MKLMFAASPVEHSPVGALAWVMMQSGIAQAP
jgi:hypothetical protein